MRSNRRQSGLLRGSDSREHVRRRMPVDTVGWKSARTEADGPSAPGSHVLKTVQLDSATRSRLAGRVAEAVAATNREPHLGPRERQWALRGRATRIAREVLSPDLVTFARRHLRRGGIVVWDRLPISEPAPSGSGELTFGQAMVAVIAQATSESFGYEQEDEGLHFQRLVPVPGAINSGRTRGDLLKHLDNPFLKPDAQPEVIHLVCVNNDAQAATEFLTMPAVLQGLRQGYGERVIERLRQPAFITAISNSFVQRADQKQLATRPRPILYRPYGAGPPSHFLGKAYDITVREDCEAPDDFQRALDAFQTVLKERQDLALPVTARPGQAISFHQQQLLHGRGSIQADRHREMVRSYGRFELRGLVELAGREPAHLVFDALQLIDR